jgi:uncharacterized protein
MTIDTVKAVASNAFSSGWVENKLTIAWHAGEPLTVPIQFYEEAYREINWLTPLGVDVKHNFQTNGMLIDERWCDFFRMTRSQVGVSVDGPSVINDLQRLTRSGRSTLAKTLRGIHTLQARGVDFEVITVITETALDRAKEIYEFYIAEGIERVSFNVEEVEGSHKHSSLCAVDMEQRFGKFLREFWNLNRKHGAIRYIREFDHMLSRIVAPASSTIENLLTQPFSIISVDCDGNFSTFCPELLGNDAPSYDNFVLGNIHATTFESAAMSPLLNRLQRDIAAGISKCRTSCDYFDVCGGGAPANKFFENKSFDSTETMHCRLIVKILARLTMEIVDRSLDHDTTPR